MREKQQLLQRALFLRFPTVVLPPGAFGLRAPLFGGMHKSCQDVDGAAFVYEGGLRFTPGGPRPQKRKIH